MPHLPHSLYPLEYDMPIFVSMARNWYAYIHIYSWLPCLSVMFLIPHEFRSLCRWHRYSDKHRINQFIFQILHLKFLRIKKLFLLAWNVTIFTYLHSSIRILCGYFSVLTTVTHSFFQFLAQPGRIYDTSDSHTKLPLCLKYPKLN